MVQVTFALREPGFLLKYEGGWAFTAEADGCAGITIGFTMQPKLQVTTRAPVQYAEMREN